MKSKADLDSIYRADLLKHRKIVDTLCYSGQIRKLVVHSDVGTLKTGPFALANDEPILALVPKHNEKYLDNKKAPWEFPTLFQTNKRKPTPSTQCSSLDKGCPSPKQWLKGSD